MDDQTRAADNNTVFRRVDDFVTGYANNIQFEPSAWDLKMVFGELNQTGGKVSIEQHTSITLSWAEAKVMLHYLHAQIAIHEFQNGRIQVPKSVLPAPPPPVPPDAPDKENAETLREMLGQMREDFLATL